MKFITEVSESYVYNFMKDKILFGNNLVLFEGEVGTGKTTIIRYLSERLGAVDFINSPTYNIMNSYNIRKTGEIINHFDFYRIENEKGFNLIVSNCLEHFHPSRLNFFEWFSRILEFESAERIWNNVVINFENIYLVKLSFDNNFNVESKNKNSQRRRFISFNLLKDFNDYKNIVES